MKDHPRPPTLVLVGGNAATRSAWAAAWSDGTSPAVTPRDVLTDPPAAGDPRPTLCLLLGSDGAPGSEATEAAARLALQRAGWAYSVLHGPLAEQLDTARRAWSAAQRDRPAAPTRWRHVCGRCGDGDCERALFDRQHGSA